MNEEQITVLENRLNKHTKNKTALQNGRMTFLPGFEDLSMFKSVEQCAQDIWAMLEGHNMLDLNFGKCLAAVRCFKRAIKQRLTQHKNGNLPFLNCYF